MLRGGDPRPTCGPAETQAAGKGGGAPAMASGPPDLPLSQPAAPDACREPQVCPMGSISIKPSSCHGKRHFAVPPRARFCFAHAAGWVPAAGASLVLQGAAAWGKDTRAGPSYCGLLGFLWDQKQTQGWDMSHAAWPGSLNPEEQPSASQPRCAQTQGAAEHQRSSALWLITHLLAELCHHGDGY